MNSKLMIDNSNSFNGISQWIEIRFEYLKKYLIEISTLIEQKLEKDRTEIESNFLKVDEKSSIFWTVISSLLHAAILLPHTLDSEKHPKYFNNSSFLFVFSILESHIIQIGKAAQKLSKSKLGHRDIHGQNDIEKVKIYIEKYLEIDLSEFDKTWTKIKDFQKIRNRIAHNQSTLEGLKAGDLKWYVDYLKKNNRLNFDENSLSFHITDTRYLIDFCDVSKTYVLGILSKLSEKFD